MNGNDFGRTFVRVRGAHDGIALSSALRPKPERLSLPVVSVAGASPLPPLERPAAAPTPSLRVPVA